MSSGNSYSWIISGRVLKIDGISPFINSDGLSVRLVNAGNPSHELANAGIDDNGNFSITLNKQQFGSVDPSLIIRVHDNQSRMLCQPDTFTLSQSKYSHSLGNIAVDCMPIPHTWLIRGLAFNNSVPAPFTQGMIRAFDGQTGTWYAESGFYYNHGQEGSFGLTINRDLFQNGDVSKTNPFIVLRIFNYQNQLLWHYGPFVVPHCDYYINPLVTIPAGSSVVGDLPIVASDWTVKGELRDENNSLAVHPLNVKAFDALYKNGSHVETLLGTQTGAAGTYQINYSKSAFQNGDTGRIAPNLRVRVFSGDDLAGESGVFNQASNPQVINVSFALKEPEIPDEPEEPETWVVSGFVRDSQGYLVTLGKVHVYDIYNDTKLEIGSVSLGSSGHYSVSFGTEQFQRENDSRPAPSLEVCLYYPAGTLLAKSDVVHNASPNQIIDLSVSSGTAVPESEYCVYGYVTNRAGLPVAHHIVEAYVLRVTNNAFAEVKLGFVATDVNGYYEINYDPSLLEHPISEDPSSHGAGTASLFIKLPRAQNTPGLAVQYDTFPIVCHSAKRQQIDIQVDRLSGSDSSEYDLVHSALSAYLPVIGNRIGEYEPSFSNRMQYISCKTGVEESKLVCFYYSMHFAWRVKNTNMLSEAQKSKLDSVDDFEKFMYAAFRAGYSGSNVLALCAAEPGEHYRALADAIRDRVIAESTTANLEPFWAQWLEIVRILTASAGVINAEAASVGVFARTILEVAHSPLAPEDVLQIQKVTEVYQNVQGDMPSFWSEMQAKASLGEFTELFVVQLAFINDLHSISDGFVPFAQGAYNFFARHKASSYSSEIEVYNIRNLASLNDEEWLGMTRGFLHYTKGEYPQHLVGGTDDEKAHILAMTTRKLYEDKFPLENAAVVYENSEDEDLQNIGAFLRSDAAAGFDLDSADLGSYVLPEGVDRDALRTLQRLNRLTEDPDAQIYLRGKGYDSAYKIASFEEEKFIADNAHELGGVEEARQIHRLAVMYATETLSILGKFHDSLNFEGESQSLMAVSRGLSRAFSATAQPSAQDPVVPTYKTLFGTLSEIRFANSQSVFGASAYFADLLGFIDGLSRKSLFSRRPELKEVELTDGNAETVLPYIDIVAEILENAISPRIFFFRCDDFLNEESAVIPEGLKEAFYERAIEIPDEPNIARSLTKEKDYYLSTGSWRMLFSYRTIENPNTSGYLITMYPQTSKESPDLAVMPEHRNPLAYEALSELYFPLQLPLNPAADEVQETLRLLGTSKHDSIIAFRREQDKRYDDTADGSLVCAGLGIGLGVKELLESPSLPDHIKAWELWGLQEGSWLSVMSSVPEFMRRTGLDVGGMLELFALKTFSHITLVGTQKGQQTGEPDEFAIDWGAGRDVAVELTKIHKAIRLRNILQCAWKELGCFLDSAHGGSLPDNLRKIHASRLFMARHPSIKLTDIGCFWDAAAADRRVALLVKALKISIDDFHALRELTEIEPFDAGKPEKLLYFADECGKLSGRSINASAVKEFLKEEPLTNQDNGRWVQSSFHSLREIVAATEIFLASGATPDFGKEGEEDWDIFKENYREEHTHSQAKNLLTELFSEFTGGDSVLADSLLDKDRDLWASLANVGWSRSLNGGEPCIVDDFSLPDDCSNATWSAVFIAPKDGEISFELNADGCDATLAVENQSITITANNFSNGYHLDLLWNNETETKLNGEPSASFAKVPLSALIPETCWTDFEALEKTLPTFRKMAEYLELTKVNPKVFRAIVEKSKTSSEWEILLPNKLGELDAWEKFKRLLDIQTLETNFPTGKSSFWEMVEEVEDSTEALECLAEIQDAWDKTNLIKMVENSIPEISETDKIASPAMLAYILENMPVIEKIGVPVDMLLAVQNESPCENDAANFRNALQQRLGMDSWNEMAKAMMNAMRVRQRDAMTAFLTYAGPCIKSTDAESSYTAYLRKVLLNAGMLESANGSIYDALRLYCELTEKPALNLPSDWEIGPAQWAVLDGRKGYRDSSELYANFLIDTEMNTEMITSRIVQGSAAVQLFVQRVLLGLEPASHLDERDIAQWAWVKNYRLWEANRKVFLYPENWIEPELRDDKTPFFKEFEAEFENGEITSEIAKKALGNFLGKIREVSGLDIIGVYRGDCEIPRGKDTLHIIGKTKSQPHKYYYRCCHRKGNLANVWAPWEAIDIDMQGNSVLPVMFNGHLHVFWAQFKPADNPGEADSISHRDSRNNDVELPVPVNTTVVDLSLCWSAFADGKWTEKRQTPSFIDTKNTFYTNQNLEANVADRYHFRVKEISAEYAQIEVRGTYEALVLPENSRERRRALLTLQMFPHRLADIEKILKIRVVGIYTVWHDGKVDFEKVTNDSGAEFHCDPKDTLFTENYASTLESQALTRLDGTVLLGKTTSGYKYLAANSGQLTGSSHEPGFLMESSRTYLIERSDQGKKAVSYRMETVSHPIVKEFQKRFENGGLPSLMRRETQALAMATGNYYSHSYYSYNYYYSVLLGYYAAGDWQAWDSGQNAFELRYLPNEGALSRPFPMDVVDFNYGTPYGIYNWELFFHAPFLAARQLSANQRYDEALDWYHLIFDPRNKLTGYEKTKRWALNLPSGARFWNFLPFFANADANKTIEDLMKLPDSRGKMPDNQALKTLIDDWKDDPFNPHLIARNRIVAYQKSVVMHYLDTLVAWADQKFRVDTLESINEAIQLYILAAEILGVRPQSVPSELETSPLSYTQMQEMNADSFSNVVVQLENSPLVRAVDDAKDTTQGAISESANQALGLGPKMYYFVVPRNEKLMGYWDLLDDRLFKIRNGMNIEGVRRQLSLFAPPIDPGMLVRAAAAGIDIGTAVSGMFAPVPKYRFTFMVQKAIELCGIVQSVGGAVLSALEKKDAEEIARLRSEHESALLRLSREVRNMQVEEAGIAIEGLEKSKESMELRKAHYEKLIESSISGLEQRQLDQMDNALEHSKRANIIRKGASISALLPDTNVGVSGLGSPVGTMITSAARAAHMIATVKASDRDFLASQSQSFASQSGINASYERREQDWEFQKSLIEKELEGIDKQILGAQIRRQIAEKELSNLEKQIEQSGEAYAFLKGKFTNKELYQWMISELSSLYSKIYKLAYDTAKRAEKSYGFELGISDSSFIKFGYWDGLRKGLLAGEQLMLDLRQMEMSYIEKNSRELEITKPVSIAELYPEAISDLQENGVCEFSLPEALFDLDFPGHYFRRIRSVRLTIPCVAGPYASISATLTLLDNSMRKNPTGSSYKRSGRDDPRFINQRIGIQGIATSQPNEAAGLFDFNFRDERYLPFEGAGAISEWRLELPAELRQFDYNSIKDIVLHVSYTAREDGRLKGIVNKWLRDSIDMEKLEA
jgi:hypothetical protein